jgi:hypothetical protein
VVVRPEDLVQVEVLALSKFRIQPLQQEVLEALIRQVAEELQAMAQQQVQQSLPNIWIGIARVVHQWCVLLQFLLSLMKLQHWALLHLVR